MAGRTKQETEGKRKGTQGRDLDLSWFKEHSAVCMAALSFLLPVFVMLVSYNASGIYPFGEEQFLYMDYYHQYLPFFTAFVRDVRGGSGIFYNWNAGLGTNFYVLYVYYLASPFHLLGLLVPTAHLGDFLAYLVVCKAGLGGLSSYLYLYHRKQSRLREEPDSAPNTCMAQAAALFFALGYALSGYLMAYNWNIMWLDCVILLPVVLWGLERLVLEGRPFLYCVALAVCIWCNFYLSIMICIFLVLYLVCLLWISEGIAGRRCRILLDFAVFSLVAGGIAAVLWIPAVSAFASTDFGAMESVDAAGNYFSVFGVFIRHCMAVKPVHMDNHWPNIYCGVSVFLFAPLFALNRRIPARRRLGMLILAGFLLLGFANPTLDLIWHGMNYPDGLPARQSFLYIMLVLLMCHESALHLEAEDAGWPKKVFLVYLAAAAYLLWMKRSAAVYGISSTTAPVFTLLFLTGYALLLFLAHRHRDTQTRGMLIFVAIAVMVLEAQVNTVETNVISSLWGESMDPAVGHSLYEQAAREEQGIFRMEMFERDTFNEGVRDEFPSASLFTSTQNSAVRAFYERFGMRHNKVFYGFDGSTPLAAALLNVKYMYGRKDAAYPDILYTPDRQEGEVQLYRVNAVLPFGYVAPWGFDLAEDEEGLALQNRLVRDLGIKEPLFEECETVETADGVMFTAPKDGIYYAMLTADGIKKVALGGVRSHGFGWNNAYLNPNSVIYLGEMAAGGQGSIRAADPGEDAEKVTADVCRLNTDVLDRAVAILSEQHMENVTFDNTHLGGSLHLEREGRLILSVPWEKGWCVRLNGEKVTPAVFGGAFIALDLQPGDYVLEMNYVPYGFWTGILVSVISVAAAVILWFVRKTRQEARNTQLFSELSNESAQK